MSYPDYRALCAELLAEIDAKAWGIRSLPSSDAIDHARAALSQPEPVAPTDEELKATYWEAFKNSAACGAEESWLAGLRAVARYAHPTLAPIPVSERLPGAEDCDGEGRCWVFDQGDAVTAPAWNLESSADLEDLRQMEAKGMIIGLCKRWRLAWLPFHALPLPAAPGEGE
jgi:hypothetical protein